MWQVHARTLMYMNPMNQILFLLQMNCFLLRLNKFIHAQFSFQYGRRNLHYKSQIIETYGLMEIQTWK